MTRRAVIPGIAAAIAGALLVTHCTAKPDPTPEPVAWAPGTTIHEIVSGGTPRTYRLHVPARHPTTLTGSARPYGIVVVLHGSGADGGDVEDQTGMDSVSEANGWLMVYPDAMSNSLGFGSDWNAGTCCGPAARDSVDDAAFVLSAIGEVASRLPTDRAHVYVAGFSAGGRLAYHLACRAPAQFAAVAVVSGSVLDARCRPPVPVPIIAFHGTADDEVPYTEASETPVAKLVTGTDSMPPAIQLWAALDRCRNPRAIHSTAHVTRIGFRRCRADVVLYRIAGGGHGWPGSKDGPGGEAPLSEIHATTLIARYFARHTR